MHASTQGPSRCQKSNTEVELLRAPETLTPKHTVQPSICVRVRCRVDISAYKPARSVASHSHRAGEVRTLPQPAAAIACHGILC